MIEYIYFIHIAFMVCIVAGVGYALLIGLLYIGGRCYSRNQDKKEYYLGIILYLLVLYVLDSIRAMEMASLSGAAL